MNKKGFTLIELLIVVAIIGIVAAIAIPNLLTALQRGKQKATMGDMKTIGNAIGSYLVDNSISPNALSDIGKFHIQKLPERDGWGHTWQYVRGATNMDEYSLGSSGRDVNFSGWNQSGLYPVQSLQDFNNDIILSNGTFTYSPKTN
ncbi:MAG: prepilin-type N-terminal cleavage/methylation domain-containing protein [Acidobacteriota bacterium]|jgi:type II secretion system protein G|nr:prepilin-type N-terminal cleavage/methylation domain-containing protein [Acidobacteriota bacterium]